MHNRARGGVRIVGCGYRTTKGTYLPHSAVPLRNEGVYLTIDGPVDYGEAIATSDWDGDGDLDMLSNNGFGKVFLYENRACVFTKGMRPLFTVPRRIKSGSSLDIVDIDNDGDLDVLAGNGSGTITLYRNMTGMHELK